MDRIALAEVKKIEYPKKETLFRPAACYPEYPFAPDIADVENHVYEAVREAFHLLGLDLERYGTDAWNPLGEIIKPGQCVLLKPNMVMDYNRNRSGGTNCLYTHPSVAAAVLDYVYIALKGSGRVIVGDAPMQECNFEKLVSESGYDRLMRYYSGKGLNIELVDFRDLKTVYKHGYRNQSIESESRGIIVNLDEDSEFSDYTKEKCERLRITNYSPDRLREHHAEGKHEYCVSRYVLEADAIINMPKPKTHRKAGVTIALKNMVGINARKEYLPHHTLGSLKDGGDEYRDRSLMRWCSARLYDKKNYCEGRGKSLLSRLYFAGAYSLKALARYVHGDETEGSWLGNETISRTIVDLNKIVLYADKMGIMRDEAQRRMLHLGDMVISGEKEGPVAPSPKDVGFIAAGRDAVHFDKVIAHMMGAKLKMLPVLRFADDPKGRYRITTDEEIGIVSNVKAMNGLLFDRVPPDYRWFFQGTKGWSEAFEKIM